MSQEKKNKPWILFLKGMAMGAADVVPGVSGGTIAFFSENLFFLVIVLYINKF